MEGDPQDKNYQHKAKNKRKSTNKTNEKFMADSFKNDDQNSVIALIIKWELIDAKHNLQLYKNNFTTVVSKYSELGEDNKIDVKDACGQSVEFSKIATQAFKNIKYMPKDWKRSQETSLSI